MKNTFLKSGLFFLLLGTFVLSTLSSCDKDDDTPQELLKTQIVGVWDFTSLKQDGYEMMGTVIDSASTRFEAYTGAEGNFQQTVLYTDGERDTINGKYTVMEAAKKLEMTYEGETQNVTVAFPASNRFEWTGTQNGKSILAKATRRQ